MKILNKLLDNKRIRRVVYSGVSALGAKGINMLVVLVSIPLTYNYLGEERFGMLMTMLSILAIMGFADLGLGLGLLNRIALFEKDLEKLKSAISSTFIFLFCVSILLLLILISIHPFIDWYKVFNVTSDLAKIEVGNMVLVFFLIFFITLPFTIIRKIQGGFQEGYYNEMWEAGGNLVSLVALLVTVHYELGVTYILMALYGVKSLFVLFNFLFYFIFLRNDLLPSIKSFNKVIFKSILSEGMLFFVLQIFAMMNTSMDTLLISHFKGASEVAVFVIGYRLFTIFMTPVQAFIYPMLPAFNDALAKNEINWVYKLLKNLLIYGVLVSVFIAIIFYYSGGFIIQSWISKETDISKELLLAFSFYIIYFNLNGIISQIMMTPLFIKYKVRIFSVASLLVFIIKFYLTKRYGIESLLWSTIIISVIFYLSPSLFIINKVLKQKKENTM